jgi:hypothetical protein
LDEKFSKEIEILGRSPNGNLRNEKLNKSNKKISERLGVGGSLL